MKKLIFISFIFAGCLAFSKSYQHHDCDHESDHYNLDIGHHIESNLILLDCSSDCINNKHAEMLLHSLKQAQKAVNKNSFSCNVEKYYYLLKATEAFFNNNPSISEKHKEGLTKFNYPEVLEEYYINLAQVNQSVVNISN
jgi:hypothetical protein